MRRLEEYTTQLNEIRTKGVQKGEYSGFESLDEIFSIKKGYPLFIAGAPHSGKSEFLFEILINTTLNMKWKHFIVSPESGSAAEIYAELCSKVVGKPYRLLKAKGEVNNFAMDEKEKVYSESLINEHFYILDPDELPEDQELTFDFFHSEVDKVQNEYSITFDTTVIDPFNDLFYDLSKFSGREDLYLMKTLTQARKKAKLNNRVDIIVTHIAKTRVTESEGIKFSLPATPAEWAGGQMWHRKAFTMLLVYRPSKGLKDRDGVPYDENVALIINQKAKPKGTGKLGEVSLYWDWKKNRYYELGENGQKYYANEMFEARLQDKYLKPISEFGDCDQDFMNQFEDYNNEIPF